MQIMVTWIWVKYNSKRDPLFNWIKMKQIPRLLDNKSSKVKPFYHDRRTLEIADN